MKTLIATAAAVCLTLSIGLAQPATAQQFGSSAVPTDAGPPPARTTTVKKTTKKKATKAKGSSKNSARSSGKGSG